MREMEKRLEGLSSRAAEQQEATRMICAVLKELDDPYGFGLSLDERLAGDGTDGSPEDLW